MTARQSLLDGNSHWVAKVVAPLCEDSEISRERLLEAGMTGLAGAVDKYSDRTLTFQPDAKLTGGYAIWWVRVQIARVGSEFGYEYDPASNSLRAAK